MLSNKERIVEKLEEATASLCILSDLIRQQWEMDAKEKAIDARWMAHCSRVAMLTASLQGEKNRKRDEEAEECLLP